MELPLPPTEMRQVVGPTDPAAFDNPSGAPVFGDLPAAAYRSVLDFGCGCGHLARQMMARDGYFESTWFLFDKRYFPMMQDFRNALYINDLNPANAVIFDRRWLVDVARGHGLTIVAASPPKMRGYHWRITMALAAKGVQAVDLPADEAPIDVGGTRATAVEPDLKPNDAVATHGS